MAQVPQRLRDGRVDEGQPFVEGRQKRGDEALHACYRLPGKAQSYQDARRRRIFA
jgi:hypothetical protein